MSKTARSIRVSCSVPAYKASPALVLRLRRLGITPIVTPRLIRGVYEGTSSIIADTLVQIFELEEDHEITLDRS